MEADSRPSGLGCMRLLTEPGRDDVTAGEAAAVERRSAPGGTDGGEK
jgi:hypothetical protein